MDKISTKTVAEEEELEKAIGTEDVYILTVSKMRGGGGKNCVNKLLGDCDHRKRPLSLHYTSNEI